jgi:D-alanyl-D-alanine endopeptidase (penicillin-binding protein 7)
MSAMIDALGWTLLHFLWQGALIGLAVALALHALRGARPQTRYLVACGGLLLCIAWPAFDLIARLGANTAASAAVMGKGLQLQVSRDEWRPLMQQHMGLIVAAWAACIGALGLRTVAGLLWIGRAARLGARHPALQLRTDRLAEALQIGRSVRLRIVDHLASPVTAGWWRPVVLVPAALVSGMPPDLLEALLAHELAHVRRFDYVINLLQNAIETVLFYHPAVWWLSRRIRAERELIADELASVHAGGPRRLALALSELEKLQFSHQKMVLAANGGDLMQRISHLLRPAPQRSGWRTAGPAIVLAATCLGLAGCATAGNSNAPVDTPAVADFTSCKKPVWPASSLKSEHTGTVTLSFLISEQGKPTDSKVVRSSGYPLLDEAARSGIMKCSFKPATRGGAPVAHWMQMQYVWTLH